MRGRREREKGEERRKERERENTLLRAQTDRDAWSTPNQEEHLKKQIPARASLARETHRACPWAAGFARICADKTLLAHQHGWSVSSEKLCFRLGEEKKRLSLLTCHSVKVSCARLACGSARLREKTWVLLY